MSFPAAAVEEPALQMAQAEAGAFSHPRLLYIENIRLVLISLVVLGHLSISYGTPAGEWYYREAGEANLIYVVISTVLLGVGSAFLLGLFFFIASYFVPRAYDRKGTSRFLVERFKRLGIPLAVFALMVNPVTKYLKEIHDGYQSSFLVYYPQNFRTAAVGPFWFVEALLIFSVLYALWRLAAGAGQKGKPTERPAAASPSNLAIFLAALSLGLTTFVVRIWAPFGYTWEPLHLEIGHLPQYGGMFVLGTLAYRRGWLDGLSDTQGRRWGWAAFALVPVLLVIALASGAANGELNPAAAGGLNLLSLAFCLWEGFTCFAMVIFTLTWFRRSFNRQGRLARELSTSAYAVYFIHPLVIVPLAVVLSDIRMDLGLKFLWVGPLGLVLTYLAAVMVRRLPLVRVIL